MNIDSVMEEFDKKCYVENYYGIWHLSDNKVKAFLREALKKVRDEEECACRDMIKEITDEFHKQLKEQEKRLRLSAKDIYSLMLSSPLYKRFDDDADADNDWCDLTSDIIALQRGKK